MRSVITAVLISIAGGALYGITEVDSVKVFMELAEESNSFEDRILYSKNALYVSQMQNDTQSIANIYNYLGAVFQDMGVLDKATSYPYRGASTGPYDQGQ
nr:hypothetical protein [Bacteroidota bacterium]